MTKFVKHTGIIVPMDISNIDTDIIIPKQFLKKNTNVGFGKYLFYNWRYLLDSVEKINTDFILNNADYENSTILLTRENFGCGSSREHAVWALVDYGFKVIIASSFSDIFYNNAMNNQLLLIILSRKEIEEIFNIVKKKIVDNCFVSLLEKKVLINNKTYFFKINPFHRFCLLNGLDNIDYTERYNNRINRYEKSIPSFFLHINNLLN